MTGWRRRHFLQAAAAAAAAGALPRRAAADPSLPIVIVGGGLAGLAAARRLAPHRPVIVLEAQDRAGGRVHTLRNRFPDELFGEAGAARIAPVHRATIGAIREAGLALTSFQPGAGAALSVIDGRRLTAAELASQAGGFLKLLPAERGKAVPALTALYTEPVLDMLGGESDGPDAYARWRSFDELDWPRWLERAGASPDAIRLLSLGGDSTGLSALYVLRQMALHRTVRGYLTLKDGLDRLPQAWAAVLGARIRTGAVVDAIDADPGGVTVRYRDSGGRQSLAASRVVLAVPLTQLRRIAITPALAKAKREAVAQVPYAPAVRILAATRDRFWRQDGHNGFARTDRPAEIWDMAHGQPGRTGLLTATIGGELGRSLIGQEEAAANRLATAVLADAFPQISREIMDLHIIRWAEEPFAEGAFAAFAPGQMTRLMPGIATPEGRLHFAGEHTSVYMGWMEGAIRSGERAAREILKADSG